MREKLSLLTEHVQADFLGLLAGLVLGDAGVISFVHLPDVFDDQLRAVLVQAVLVARLKDDVVAVGRQKERRHTFGVVSLRKNSGWLSRKQKKTKRNKMKVGARSVGIET